jgi:hypothetical protein
MVIVMIAADAEALILQNFLNPDYLWQKKKSLASND